LIALAFIKVFLVIDYFKFANVRSVLFKDRPEAAAKYECNVALVRDDVRADGKSVLSLLTLGASEGVVITLETDGPDANAALESLTALITSGFPAVVEPSE